MFPTQNLPFAKGPARLSNDFSDFRRILARHKRRKCLAIGSEELSCLSVCAPKWTLCDVTSQEHAWLLSFLSVEKQDTFSAGYEIEAKNRLPFSTNQKSINNIRGAWEAVLPGGLF